jgi:hypothetical protein
MAGATKRRLVYFMAGAPFTVEFCEQRRRGARGPSAEAPQHRPQRARPRLAQRGKKERCGTNQTHAGSFSGGRTVHRRVLRAARKQRARTVSRRAPTPRKTRARLSSCSRRAGCKQAKAGLHFFLAHLFERRALRAVREPSCVGLYLGLWPVLACTGELNPICCETSTKQFPFWMSSQVYYQ